MYWLIGRYATIFGVGLTVGWVINGWRLDSAFSAYKANILAAEARLEREYRQKERELQETANRVKKEKEDEIKVITNRLNTVLSQLRERPGRVPDAARASAGATGAELSRQDAEFLARIAAEADAVVLELNQCIKTYGAAR